MDEQKMLKLQTWVKEAKRIVFFGGAGVSTESGIPDFRGEDGFIASAMPIRPKPSFPIRFISVIPIFSSIFIAIACSIRTQSPIPFI